MTYRDLLNRYKCFVEEHGKEITAVKFIIQELSSFNSSDFVLNYENEVDENLLKKIIIALNDYIFANVPAQYLVGYTYFYGLKFKVNENTLIPRRETEELVDYIIKNQDFKNPKILDIGTGSGAISVSLKAKITDAIVTGVDISKEALKVAKDNAISNNQEVEFLESDLFQNINSKYDIIVSNPPYISKSEDVDNLVLANEPHLALFALDGGLYFYKEILDKARNHLNYKSLIAFEIPEDKDDELIKLVKKYYPTSEFLIKKDLQNKSRILIVRNNWW